MVDWLGIMFYGLRMRDSVFQDLIFLVRSCGFVETPPEPEVQDLASENRCGA